MCYEHSVDKWNTYLCDDLEAIYNEAAAYASKIFSLYLTENIVENWKSQL
jgi:hypothetical protein